MYLRELIENLFARDWGGVLIEIAILMIGVFLGLQANKWNDARKKAAEEKAVARKKAQEEKAAARKAAGGMIERPVHRPTKKQRRQIHRFKEDS